MEKIEGVTPRKIAQSKTELNIDKTNFVRTPEKNILIEMEQTCDDAYNYENIHKNLLRADRFMPTPAIFMPYFVNVIQAKAGKTKIYDGAGTAITGDRLDGIYKRLTSDCLVWLNAKFVNGSGFKNLDLETVLGLDKEGSLITERNKLKRSIAHSCCAELSFNSQGFPKTNSERKYRRGKNFIGYSAPREGAAMVFCAAPDWHGIPRIDYLHPNSIYQGVFACIAETVTT